MNNKAPFETAPAVNTTANMMKPVISFNATDAFLMKSVCCSLAEPPASKVVANLSHDFFSSTGLT